MSHLAKDEQELYDKLKEKILGMRAEIDQLTEDNKKLEFNYKVIKEVAFNLQKELHTVKK